MTLYQKEKSSIRIGYHYFIMAAFLYFYLLQVQSEVTLQIYEMTGSLGVSGSVILAPAASVSFSHLSFWLGLITVLSYLNHRLFWIWEHGHLAFIPKKFDALPVTRLELYKAKGKVLLKAYAIFLIISLIIYFETIFSNYLSKALWLEAIPQILLCALLGFLIILALLGIDYLQDIRTAG